jgi:hypothetical protein
MPGLDFPFGAAINNMFLAVAQVVLFFLVKRQGRTGREG